MGESGYADILKQVRDADLPPQLHERLELAEQDKRNAVKLAQAQVANELQRRLRPKMPRFSPEGAAGCGRCGA